MDAQVKKCCRTQGQIRNEIRKRKLEKKIL